MQHKVMIAYIIQASYFNILTFRFSKNKINYINLPKSGFNSVGKLSFLDIFAEK